MTSERITTIACAIAALLIASCSDTENHAESQDRGHVAHWGYETADGPGQWANMDPAWRLCSDGQEQSPIDFTNATERPLPEGKIETPSAQQVEVLNQQGVIDALDNGHTIQINAKTGETMTIGEKTFTLVQFHFHAPSEHTVNGKRFPMEMHFVHQADNSALAVVGILVEEGDENPGLKPLWDQLEEAPGSSAIVRIPREFADSVFPDPYSGVYHYRGSLTTPPCSEGVQWFVRKTTTRLSKEQIESFTAVYNHNNRPVQMLNERTLYLDENPKVIIY